MGSRNSLTGLLMSRSEDAVALKKKEAPASPAPDIDSRDKSNPLAAADYAGDIFAYYRRVEPLFRTAPDYMKGQVGARPGQELMLLSFSSQPDTALVTRRLTSTIR